MNPSSAPDIRRLTDDQRRTLWAKIRNARMQGYDGVQIRFLRGRDIKVVAQKEGMRETVKPDG